MSSRMPATARKQGSREFTPPATTSQNSAPSKRSSVRSSVHGGIIVETGSRRYVKGTMIEKPSSNDDVGILGILKHPLNLMVLCLPVGLYAYIQGWSDPWIFWMNFLAMIPLAKILGDATEELQASLKNDMLAGLLNATFGNAVEMVITIQTLRAGLLDVVKATLLGSVLSNTLLVLGASFFCGGLVSIRKDKKTGPPQYENLPQGDFPRQSSARSGQGDIPRQSSARSGNGSLSPSPPANPEYSSEREEEGWMMGNEKIQSFSVLGALVNTSMLLISCMSFSLITVFRSVAGDIDDAYRENILLPVSRISSVIIMMAYVAYIFFQLVTHKEAMNEEGDSGGGDEADTEEHLTLYKSVGLLFGTTVIIASASEMLVHAIKGMSKYGHMSQHFIGIILLPFVGNACEHAAAVRFAVQDKLGLSVSIAVGSSTQIALFVVPFAVLVGWAIDQPMDLDFGTLNTAMITLSVIVVMSMVVDGQSNWLQGYLLMSVYTIIAVMYAYLPDETREID